MRRHSLTGILVWDDKNVLELDGGDGFTAV